MTSAFGDAYFEGCYAVPSKILTSFENDEYCNTFKWEIKESLLMYKEDANFDFQGVK